MNNPILAPAAVLVAWSLFMLLWMATSRFKALSKIDLKGKDSRGARGSDLEGILPREAQWKSHNYTHLMEQPTLFYAAVAILALAGAGQMDAMLAWAYVVFRIAHSVWQATINTIPVRFALFLISSCVLIAMAVRAVLLTLG